jgi:hypothetical protein
LFKEVTNCLKSNAIGITDRRTGAVERKWIYPNTKGQRDSKVRCKGSNGINSRGRFICNLGKVGCQQMEGCQSR